MATSDKVTGKEIVKLLLLMYLAERAIGGFIQWAYKDAPDQFDKHFRDHLTALAERDREAGAKDIHFTIANVSEFLSRAKAQRDQPGLRGGVDRMRRLGDNVRQLAIFRNTVMHGDIPDTDLKSLVELTAEIFGELVVWVTSRRLIDPLTGDVFGTWRYLNLQQPEIEVILDRQSLLTRTVDVTGTKVTFLRRLQIDKAARPQGRSKKLPIIETWVSTTERPRMRVSRPMFDRLVLGELKKARELKSKTVRLIRPNFRPLGHDRDPFLVPYWEPLEDDETADYLGVEVV